MRVLVTGCGGYIGSTLLEVLLEKGYQVIGLDRFFFGRELLSDLERHPSLKLIKDDIRWQTRQKLEALEVDAVVDMAAISNDPAGELDPNLTMDINYRGRVRIANLCKELGIRRYILISSCSVYGNSGDKWVDETSKTNPLTTYAKANLLAEREILKLAGDNFCPTVLRLATVFGVSRRMRFDLAVNLMVLNAVQKGKIFIMGGGKQWRPLIHIRDVADAIVLVLESDVDKICGQIFNVGSNELNFRIKNLAYLVREVLPFPIVLEEVPGDPDRRSYRVKFDKIRDMLKFEPKRKLDTGICEIYNALKQGELDFTPITVTVEWYKYLIQAYEIVREVVLEDKLF